MQRFINAPKGIKQKREERTLKFRTQANTLATVVAMGGTLPTDPIPQPKTVIKVDKDPVTKEKAMEIMADTKKKVIKKKIVSRKKK